MDAAIKPPMMDSESQPKIPEKTFFDILRKSIFNVFYILQNYGWYILGASIICMYVWSKIKPHIYKWLKEMEDREYAAKYHKDPELIFKQQEAIEMARLKMAQKYEADAERAAERRKELEEKKRQEWLQRQEGNLHPGHRLNGDLDNGPARNHDNDESSNKKKSARFKEDYNPLMGGGSRGYRPSRRSLCPSGGCG